MAYHLLADMRDRAVPQARRAGARPICCAAARATSSRWRRRTWRRSNISTPTPSRRRSSRLSCRRRCSSRWPRSPGRSRSCCCRSFCTPVWRRCCCAGASTASAPPRAKALGGSTPMSPTRSRALRSSSPSRPSAAGAREFMKLVRALSRRCGLECLRDLSAQTAQLEAATGARRARRRGDRRIAGGKRPLRSGVFCRFSPCSRPRPSCRCRRSPTSAASSPTRSPRRIGCTRVHDEPVPVTDGPGTPAPPPRHGGSAIVVDHVGFTYPGTRSRRRCATSTSTFGQARPRAGRSFGLRQDDARQSSAALLGSDARRHHARRLRSAANTSSTRCAAASPWSRRTRTCSTIRSRANVALAKPGAGEAEIMQAFERAALGEFVATLAGAARHPRRRARRATVRRPAPARRDRPRVPQERAGADPRRGHLASRRDQRGAGAPRARRADARSHHDRDRAPPVDGARCRSDRGARGRPPGRDRERMPSLLARGGLYAELVGRQLAPGRAAE